MSSVASRIKSILLRSPRVQLTYPTSSAGFVSHLTEASFQPASKPAFHFRGPAQFETSTAVVSLTTGHIDPVSVVKLFLQAKRAPERVSVAGVPVPASSRHPRPADLFSTADSKSPSTDADRDADTERGAEKEKNTVVHGLEVRSLLLIDGFGAMHTSSLNEVCKAREDALTSVYGPLMDDLNTGLDAVQLAQMMRSWNGESREVLDAFVAHVDEHGMDVMAMFEDESTWITQRLVWTKGATNERLTSREQVKHKIEDILRRAILTQK
ncbi:putative mitochondrial protein [Andalucia godoyi]|uniref:Putative mitochondrial protein n=1 Tax=Andalucia godoyi TaxID=505711 RepID=A0A8K0AK18_ANDGO|nr:putative mitochondrial protein [Andalucia godoyi]|eukprot:ANDGO_04538.mRNA.1 putative mitochondrial protein